MLGWRVGTETLGQRYLLEINSTIYW